MRIVVVGIGYVGVANAVVLSRSHDVIALDTNAERIEAWNRGRPLIEDEGLEQFISQQPVRLSGTTDPGEAYPGAEVVVVATPTDYSESARGFDTSSVELVVQGVCEVAPEALIVIRSTVPIGFTQMLRKRHPNTAIVVAPEFLREGSALYDSLQPTRVVVGGDPGQGRRIANLLVDASECCDVPVLLTSTAEAESIKLFANAYLALRIGFFNELDTFAASHGMDTRTLIDGLGHDPRIGHHYNNPSFGYGGYCLPKDTRELRSSYRGLPQSLITSIVDANEKRKDFIVTQILAREPHTIGIYRLTMKSGSDNTRSSSVHGVIERLLAAGTEVLVYEPLLTEPASEGLSVCGDLAEFKRRSDIVVANRWDGELEDIADKVYCRDIFCRG